MLSPENITIFITYAVEDQPILDKLLEHLSPLRHSGLVNDIHHNGSIDAGLNWEKATQEALSHADIILLLVSSDFMASDNCYNKEMQEALNLEARGDVRTIPVIVRSCLWEDSPFSKLNALPAGGKKAVSDESWGSPDEPFTESVRSIRETILEMKGLKQAKIQRGETLAPREIPLFKNTQPAPERRKGFSLKVFGIPIISFMLTLGIALFLVVPFLLNNSSISDSSPSQNLRNVEHNARQDSFDVAPSTRQNKIKNNQPPAILKDSVTQLFGFVVSEGDTIPPSYQAVQAFSQGLAAAKMGNKWGYIDLEGDVVIEFNYNDAKPFTDTIAEVKLNKKWVKINKKGVIIVN